MSKHIIEVVRCDSCDVESTESEPVETLTYSYRGRDWESDLCPVHFKEAEVFFERLSEISRRTVSSTGTVTRRRSPNTKASKAQTLPDGTPKYDQWKDPATGQYKCPASGCYREFTAPHSLSVHHTRTHGVTL